MRHYLTPKEIAKFEHVDPDTVRRWARQDVFKDVRKVGREYRIPIESYEQWREGTKVLSENEVLNRSDVRTDERTELPQ